jgi:hypothetical protein
MPNPWLAISLEDYEGHMGSDDVRQLEPLSDLFRCALDLCRPESVAVLGIAGGNGLERVDPTITKRIVGVDIHAGYLGVVQQRYRNVEADAICY